MSNDKFLISIVGSTAIGKTSLSIKLAQHFNTEIISSDSRQFYKEMRIGTAVPTQKELNDVPHHFIQNISIHTDYNVGQFEKDVLNKLNELYENQDVIVMVGGSGLYLDAVLKGLDYFPSVNPEIRVKLNQQLKKYGLSSLQEQLKELDMESFNSIEIENPHRIIRALEICIGTGKPYSFYKNKPKIKRNFTAIKIGLDAPREIIYDRINQRVDIMIDEGLLDEAKNLYQYRNLNALQTVGYKELFNYFDGDISLNAAIEEIKKNTRRYAKRQNTWFKKDKEIQWFGYKDSINQVLKYIELKLN